MSYSVAVIARNAADTIRSTLDSVLNQTLRPTRILVVNDGSTDKTERFLSDYVHSYGRFVQLLTQPDRGYDIRRVPANINLALRTAETELPTDFFMISGDDCTYPADYAKTLVDRMLAESRVVVASGQPSSGKVTSQEKVPSGSGRMVNCRFWRAVGGRYPLRAGWETWLLYKAEEKGFKVRLFDDLAFGHARPRGAKHRFFYWGAAMQTLGYHPLYALGRIAKNVLSRSMTLRGSLVFFRGYLQACLGSEDSFISPFEPTLRRFVRTSQARRIIDMIAALL